MRMSFRMRYHGLCYEHGVCGTSTQHGQGMVGNANCHAIVETMSWQTGLTNLVAFVIRRISTRFFPALDLQPVLSIIVPFGPCDDIIGLDKSGVLPELWKTLRVRFTWNSFLASPMMYTCTLNKQCSFTAP